MSAIQSGYAILSGLSQGSTSRDVGSLQDKLSNFWSNFNSEMKDYVTAMDDDSTEYVEIMGQTVKKDGSAAQYLLDKWNYETTGVVDAVVRAIRSDLDFAKQIFSIFGS
ncbi:MAG: hypothetical protein WC529_08040 [Candidatus Margulisiibacteriota bacterium]